MPRFVVLTHDHPFLHWDLLLEPEGDDPAQDLQTWRLLAEPDSGGTIRAERLADHRRIYLDYEGPVSKNRGEVHRWDSGAYEWERETRGDGALRLFLKGEKLNGAATLLCDGERWCFEMQSLNASEDANSPL